MKKIRPLLVKLTVSAALSLALFVPAARAGVYSLTGSGPTIAANSVTNFTALAPIGTFQLYPQSLYISTANAQATTNQLVHFARLTFDGTNFFTIPQNWIPNTGAPLTNALWAITNSTFTVYGQLVVSNLSATPVTNYQANLQF
jgi:hypothetical protein